MNHDCSCTGIWKLSVTTTGSSIAYILDSNISEMFGENPSKSDHNDHKRTFAMLSDEINRKCCVSELEGQTVEEVPVSEKALTLSRGHNYNELFPYYLLIG
jgi:hypothetical protein